MNIVFDNQVFSGQPWHTKFNAADQTLEISFAKEMTDKFIDSFLHSIQSSVNLVPVKTFIIQDDHIENDHLGLDWKIIEALWEVFCENGGKNVIISHRDKLPAYVKKMYADALESYGIPLNLEFNRKAKQVFD